jgi:class 3 adenylate cyclase
MSVVTFLFTDIEGSTRRWEADPDAMRTALEVHNKVLRDAVQAHEGRVFNYTGDGMCAVFDSPHSAVDAAIAAQLALELPVRMASPPARRSCAVASISARSSTAPLG